MAYFNNWTFQIIYDFISFFFWLYLVGFQVLSFLCGITSPYHIFYKDTPCMIFLGIGYDWCDIWVTSVCVCEYYTWNKTSVNHQFLFQFISCLIILII